MKPNFASRLFFQFMGLMVFALMAVIGIKGMDLVITPDGITASDMSALPHEGIIALQPYGPTIAFVVYMLFATFLTACIMAVAMGKVMGSDDLPESSRPGSHDRPRRREPPPPGTVEIAIRDRVTRIRSGAERAHSADVRGPHHARLANGADVDRPSLVMPTTPSFLRDTDDASHDRLSPKRGG